MEQKSYHEFITNPRPNEGRYTRIVNPTRNETNHKQNSNKDFANRGEENKNQESKGESYKANTNKHWLYDNWIFKLVKVLTTLIATIYVMIWLLELVSKLAKASKNLAMAFA
jgi:hypothetical protein